MKSDFMAHYQNVQKTITLGRYKELNEIAQNGQIVFCGSSLCEQFPIYEILQSLHLPYKIYNRGVGGFTMDEFIEHIDLLLFDLAPRKIFINIGSNDIGNSSFSSDDLFQKYSELLSRIRAKLKNAEIFVLSYYPVNKQKSSFITALEKEGMFNTRNNENIKKMNQSLEILCKDTGYTFVNLYDSLIDPTGNLAIQYTIEGVHLWPSGYFKIFETIKKYF